MKRYSNRSRRYRKKSKSKGKYYKKFYRSFKKTAKRFARSQKKSYRARRFKRRTFRAKSRGRGYMTKKQTQRYLRSQKSKGSNINHVIETSNGVLAKCSTDSCNWAVIEGVNSPNAVHETYDDIQGNYMSGGGSPNTGLPALTSRLQFLNMRMNYEFYARPIAGAISEETEGHGTLTDVTVWKLTARHDVPKTAEWGDINALITDGFAVQWKDAGTQVTAAVIINNPASSPFQNELLCRHFKLKQIVRTRLGGRQFSFKLSDYYPAITFDHDYDFNANYLAYKGSHFYLIKYHGALAMGSGDPASTVLPSGMPHYQPQGGMGFMRTSSYQWLVNAKGAKLFSYEDFVTAPTADDNNLARSFMPPQEIVLSGVSN